MITINSIIQHQQKWNTYKLPQMLKWLNLLIAKGVNVHFFSLSLIKAVHLNARNGQDALLSSTVRLWG